MGKATNIMVIRTCSYDDTHEIAERYEIFIDGKPIKAEPLDRDSLMRLSDAIQKALGGIQGGSSQQAQEDAGNTLYDVLYRLMIKTGLNFDNSETCATILCEYLVELRNSLRNIERK